MDALVATVEQETTLVRAGKLKDAVALEITKSELARLYASDSAQVKANLPVLSTQIPDLLAVLRPVADHHPAAAEQGRQREDAERGGEIPGAEQDQSAVDAILSRGPTGAVALAGVAVAIVVAIWVAFYLFVFLPRG